MRIAIVGGGVSGLVVAASLAERHEITLFEAGAELGGHVCTVDVGGIAVDTGFIVYNRENYPEFSKLLDRLEVATKPTRMSFSLSDPATGLEYSASSVGALFARWQNALSPSHWRFVRDLGRLSRLAGRSLEELEESSSIGLAEWLEREGYGSELIERFAVPIGAAIWSTRPQLVRRFPARFFLGFLEKHRMLARAGQPAWRVVVGGSRRYVERLAEPFSERVRLSTPVESVARRGDHVVVSSRAGEERYDQVVLATHSDQALALLSDPSEPEREILGSIPYQENEVVLHTDERLLPRASRARACWNYHLLGEARPVALTYDMNRLQGLDAEETFCVTLNHRDAIDPARVIRTFRFAHPLFGPESTRAQARYAEIGGRERRTHFAGAYWGYGFHEDGVESALRVVRELA